MYLYLDLIWLLNFAIDYLLLWMTALFRKYSFQKWRVALAALIGSGYVLFLFFPPLQPLYTFSIKLILAFFIVWVAFGYHSMGRFLSFFFTFYFVSFVTGGGMLAVHFFLQSEHEIMQGMVATQSAGYGDPVSWLFVIIAFPILLWFTHSRWSTIAKTKAEAHMLLEVEVHISGQKMKCSGLVDTGNRLYEPLTKTPVMLMEAELLVDSLPQSVQEMVHAESMSNIDHSDVPHEWLTRIRIVPYKGVKQNMDFMVAVRPDQVQLRGESQLWLPQNVLIGLQRQGLSADGRFQAIVHPDLISETYVIEHDEQKEAMT